MSTFYSFPAVSLIGFFIKSLGGAICPTQVRGKFDEIGLRFREEGLSRFLTATGFYKSIGKSFSRHSLRSASDIPQ